MNVVFSCCIKTPHIFFRYREVKADKHWNWMWSKIFFYVSSKCNVDDREFVVMSDFLLLLYQLILAGLINEEAPNQAKVG